MSSSVRDIAVSAAEELRQRGWLTDGSLIDTDVATQRLCARAGWAFAALDEAGNVVCAACGQPPRHYGSVFAAELWALVELLRSAPPFAVTEILTDCLSLATAFDALEEQCGCHSRFARA